MVTDDGVLRFAMRRMDKAPWNAINIDDIDEVDVR